jgi:N4-gp56 family major capsid protein
MDERIHELGSMGTADVNQITPKVLSQAIEQIARESVIWAQFYKTNTDLMSNGGYEVVFPTRKSGVTASWSIAPGTGLTATAMSFSAVTITVVKAGVGIGLYGEAIRQTNVDVVQENLNEAGYVWAETLDIAAFEAMFPTATCADCNGGSFVAASIGVVGIKSVAPSTLTGFTIVNLGTSSSITVATDVRGTVTYWYVPSTAAYRGISAGASSFTAKDILTVKNAILGNKYHPDVAVVHPERLADLIYDSSAKFLEAAAYQGNGPAFTGELGMLFGLRLVTNVHASSIAAVEIDTARLGYQVVRKELDLQRDQYTGMSMDTMYFWGFTERNFGVVNTKSYGAICLKGTYSVAAGIGSGYP